MNAIQNVTKRLENGGRVLVTRTQFLGDVVLTLPVVDALRNRFVGAEIDYLTKAPGADLLDGDERFSRVYTVPGNAGGAVRSASATMRLLRELRSRQYDVAIDLFSNPRSAWLTRATGATVRIGGSRRFRKKLYTHSMSVPQEVSSATDFHMWHLRPLGISDAAVKPSITISERERETARDLLRKNGLETGRRTVGVHPGGKWQVKRWPTRYFAELIRALHETSDVRVVVFTGPDEAGHTERLRDQVGDAAIFLRPYSIRTVAALISCLDAMVACDGGVMHVSAAVGTPTVGIFGSSEPRIWFPYAEFGPHRAALVDVPCRPCHQHECPYQHTDCLNKLQYDSVLRCLSQVIPQLVSAV